MPTNSRINLKMLSLAAALMILSVGLTATTLTAATFDASMTSTLTLTGITLPGVTGPSPTSLSNINFAGSLELPNTNTVSGDASIDGTFVSYTINGHEVRTGSTGTEVSFGSSAGFGIGDYFSLNAEAFSTSDPTTFANAFAGGIGTLDLTSTSNFDYQVYFNLIWSMSANTTASEGVNAVAETFILADIIDSNGRTSLADTLGRSVNGAGNFTNFTVSSDFSLLLASGDASSIEVQFNEALGYIDSGGQGPPDPINPVPIPATIWLFGSALAGMAGLRQRFKKNS